MADLRAHLEELPFKDINTYIQRGNIVFSRAIDDLAIIKSMIYNKIYEKYQFEIPTLILEPDVLDYVLSHNPFLQEDKDPKRLYITFLNDVPAQEYVDNLDAKAYLPEDFVLDGKIIFFYSPSGYGRAKMNNNFFEQKLKVDATTRNWRTIHKLRGMVG